MEEFFMSKVAIVSDSTATIPLELLNHHKPIYTVPLQVIWKNHIYRDGIDITSDDFYKRLVVEKELPTTSQTTPETFRALYGQLLDEGYDILSIHISARLSGTLDSAIQAKANFPGAKIELLDSETTSMAMGFQVLTAARAASQGASLEECKTLAERSRENSGVYFVVNTLEYLRRGGRIGGAAAFLGSALNLKPILELRNGRIEAVERVRTLNKALDRLLDLFEAKVNKRTPVRIAALHATTPNEAAELLDRARSRFGTSDVSEAVISTISPVLGTHVGPGCLGIAFLAGM
jgi:DegV family protein with EDD domain